MNLQTKIKNLFYSQKIEWDLLRINFKQLEEDTKIKPLFWDNETQVILQYNPLRFKSTTAQVDNSNIEKRSCFLCAENRPQIQKGIPFLDKYIILCNPYPILKNHLTIHLNSHVPK